jgi:hypothetical protein
MNSARNALGSHDPALTPPIPPNPPRADAPVLTAPPRPVPPRGPAIRRAPPPPYPWAPRAASSSSSSDPEVHPARASAEPIKTNEIALVDLFIEAARISYGNRHARTRSRGRRHVLIVMKHSLDHEDDWKNSGSSRGFDGLDRDCFGRSNRSAPPEPTGITRRPPFTRRLGIGRIGRSGVRGA